MRVAPSYAACLRASTAPTTAVAPGQKWRSAPLLDALPAIVEAAAVCGVFVLIRLGDTQRCRHRQGPGLGATAVGIGRPYAYGLALGGVERR